MKTKRKFVVSLIVLQLFFVVIAFLVVSSLVKLGSAQDTNTPFSETTSWMLGISAAISIAGSTIAAGIAIKSVGTAAISALTENEAVFFKAFLVIALGEALAIYGVIVSILLWLKIPSP
jgi:V/A-type H+/Na+-transporting ATPase subunit K